MLVSRATSFSLGNLVIRKPVIYVSQNKGGALASSQFDGVIGSEILRRFKVVFDHARGRLILEPSAHYAEPVDYDMSGMRLRADGNNFRIFRVYQVLEGSPAADAGLRAGDVLVISDGVAASRFSLDEIYQMLKQHGREYQLSFRRGERLLSVKIKMRRLI
jgi:predicted metalloprotease with PDZ domain